MSKNTLQVYQEEITREISNPETSRNLLATTFKGLELGTMKQAMLKDMMRGFSFKDFLEKNVYAIPFKGGYSLITSVDYARKVGMRSGVVGKSAPVYELDEQGNIISCEITIKKKIDNYIGEFTAKVYFSEYNTGFNLWKTKPRTMIAKVAEMHALRMACPEELSQAYLEEEMSDKLEVSNTVVEETYMVEVDNIKTIEELKSYYEKNKGKGKEFDRYVTKRKNEINANS